MDIFTSLLQFNVKQRSSSYARKQFCLMQNSYLFSTAHAENGLMLLELTAMTQNEQKNELLISKTFKEAKPT